MPLKDPLIPTHLPCSPVTTLLSLYSVTASLLNSQDPHQAAPQQSEQPGNSSSTLLLILCGLLLLLKLEPWRPLPPPATCHSPNSSSLSGRSTLGAFAPAGLSGGALFSPAFPCLAPQLTPQLSAETFLDPIFSRSLHHPQPLPLSVIIYLRTDLSVSLTKMEAL